MGSCAVNEVAPDTNRGKCVMKKTLFLLFASVLLANISISAQKKNEKGNVIFQEATAREAFPNLGVFVFPEICDLEMIETVRMNYGPYDFQLAKDLSSMTNGELNNAQSRALQRACAVAGADLIIEPLYTSTVYDKENKILWVSLSGYPAKYVNFRKLSKDDMEMIRTLYPHGVEGIQRQNAGHVLSTATEGAK